MSVSLSQQQKKLLLAGAGAGALYFTRRLGLVASVLGGVATYLVLEQVWPETVQNLGKKEESTGEKNITADGAGLLGYRETTSDADSLLQGGALDQTLVY